MKIPVIEVSALECTPFDLNQSGVATCEHPEPISLKSGYRMSRSIWLICLAGLMIGLTQPWAAGSSALPAYSQRYDPARDPFADGRAALELAQGSNRRVLIEIGGDWCDWCRLLDRFLKEHPDVLARLHENFVLLKVNFDEVNENAEFLGELPQVHGYPHLFISDSTGAIIHSQDTTEFLHDGNYSTQRFNEFIDRWAR
jgi:thiol:disulfide interchange protein